MNSKASFVVNFRGKFTTVHGVVEYVDGLVETVECEPRELWRVLEAQIPVPLFRQRMWYKLPDENITDLKFLWSDGDDVFEEMCDKAQRASFIDIFMEDDGSVESRIPEEEIEATEPVANSASVPVANSQPDQTNQQSRFEEEERVEAAIADINEDSDEERLPSTPIPSDNEEEEEVDPNQYEVFQRGSGELKISQKFTSLDEFKDALLEYALKGGWNIKYARWGATKSEAVCAVEGEEPCHWRIYVSREESIDAFLVKTFNDQHTCIKDGRCSLLTDNIIAKMFVNELRTDPKLQPKYMQEKIEEKYNIICTHDQIRKAKAKGLKIIQKEYDEQYSKIKDYELEIKKSNPGSTTELHTVMRAGPLEVFEKFYVCYEALRTSWLQCSRRVIGIDGCHLKNGAKAILLAVVGRDGNNCIYPIAWAVVQLEDEPNWSWFISKIQQDLRLGNGQGVTLISDRQKGLLAAVEEVLPAVEHRSCARHVYGNICKFHPKRGRFKKMFWDIVQSFTVADYEANLQKLKEYDIKVWEAFMERNPRDFCRAFFKTETICEDTLNNNSESYNHTIEKARYMPLIEMLETMRRQAMVRIDMRRVKAMNHKGKFCPRVGKLIKKEEEFKKYCRSFPGPTGLFEVVEIGTGFRISMTNKTCTCRRWDLTGVPCRHALRVIMDKKLNAEDYVANCFLTNKWQRQYSYNINPLVGVKFWAPSGKPTLQAPVREATKGRPKKYKRIKQVNEDPKGGKKLSTHARLMHCSKCGQEGHYKNKCNNVCLPSQPAPTKKRKKKKTAEQEPVEVTQGGEAPIEHPSQPAPTKKRKKKKTAEQEPVEVTQGGEAPIEHPTQED